MWSLVVKFPRVFYLLNDNREPKSPARINSRGALEYARLNIFSEDVYGDSICDPSCPSYVEGFGSIESKEGKFSSCNVVSALQESGANDAPTDGVRTIVIPKEVISFES